MLLTDVAEVTPVPCGAVVKISGWASGPTRVLSLPLTPREELGKSHNFSECHFPLCKAGSRED